MTHLLDTALHYAATFGWAVHPVNIKKRPTTAHGRDDATIDEATIRQFFSNGAQIAVATGPESGLFVLDIDVDPEKGINGYETLAYLEGRYGTLPHTPHQRTGRGGTQYLFKHVPGLKNSTGKLGAGIDTRGEGGYAVVAPSRNTNGPYEWIVSPDDASLADVPQWLIDLLLADDRPAVAPSASGGSTDAYARAALAGELARLAKAVPTTRNATLNRCAFSLGQLVGCGALGRAEVEAALSGVAAAIGLDARETAATIRSGLDAGENDPRQISDHLSDHLSDHTLPDEPPHPAGTASAPPPGASQAPRFEIAIEDVLYELPPLTYLDREMVLCASAFHLIYGASGSGKTFFAIERAMRQAAQGRRVLYIPTEDVSGLRYRVAAWRVAHPEASGRLTWLQMPYGLDLQDHKQVAELLDTIEPFHYDHIVLDTLREAHSGDENSSQDTARINRAIQRLVATGAAVDVVHHTGVAGERPRGSTALFGNCDVVIRVENDDGLVRASFDKIRNAAPRDSLAFGLVQQDSGLLDSSDQPVISCILRPGSQFTRRDAKLTPTQRKVLETLALSIFAECGAKAQQVIDTSEITRRHVYLALAALKSRGFVGQASKGDPFFITRAGRAELTPELTPAPSDLDDTASESASDLSDQDVISSDLHTTSSESDVIHSDHTRRVITDHTLDHIEDTTPPNQVSESIRAYEQANADFWQEVIDNRKVVSIPKPIDGISWPHVRACLAGGHLAAIRMHCTLHKASYEEVLAEARHCWPELAEAAPLEQAA